MTIMVIGGAGFIGSHLIYKLMEKNHRVIVMDNCSNGNADYIDGYDVEFLKTDICEYEAVKIIISENPDILVHFAA